MSAVRAAMFGALLAIVLAVAAAALMFLGQRVTARHDELFNEAPAPARSSVR